MTRRSKSMVDGTNVKIPEVFRAPEALEETSQTRKRKQGVRNEEDMKRRNTSEPDIQDGKIRKNMIAGLAGVGPIPTQIRKPSGLPVSRGKTVDVAEEAAPPGAVAVPNP